MIQLPDFDKRYEYENNFYLTCENTRLSKIISHYELFKMIKNLPGDIVECGVFKGASFVRFAGFRSLMSNVFSHKLIGFDTFKAYPETNYADDKKIRNGFIEAAGSQSISKKQLFSVLEKKHVAQNVELVDGNIIETVPQYIRDNSNLKICLLNLDTDIYEPAVVILENMWSRIVTDGVLIIDNYGTFPGETKAVDDFFKSEDVKILKHPFAMTPCYIVKG